MRGEHEPRPGVSAAAHPAAGASVALPSLVAVDVNMPPALPRVTRSEAISLAAAIAVHGCLLAPLFLPDSRIGGGGFDVDAIGVEIVTIGPALEARSSVRGREASASRQTVRDQDGDPQPAPEETASRDSRREETIAPAAPAPAPADLVVPEWRRPETPPDAAATEPLIAPARAAGERQDAIPPIRPSIAEAAAAETASIPGVQIVARDPGGAAARGRDAFDPNSAAMAAARLGRRDAYGMAVRAAVAQSVQPPGEPGQVRLEFWIEPTGRVEQVRVVSSSGNRRVDGAAVAAARGAQFPPRPPELAGQTLSYDITLTFTIGQ